VRTFFLSFLLLCSFSIPLVSKADQAAMSILEKMVEAANEETYQGVFNFQTARGLQTIKVYRRHDARGDLERLVSLNGPAREVIRSNEVVRCINPKGNQVNVSRRPLGRGFPGDLPRRLSAAADYYDLSLSTEARIAGRQAQQLNIIPLDEYRYGYRLWVDVDTHLMLKSELVDAAGNVLEMFAFTSLETDVHIPDHKFESEIEGEALTRHLSEPESSTQVAAQRSESGWMIDWLPDGFSLVAMQTRMRAKNGAEVEQRVYSDGLSSVSLFFEKILSRHAHLRGQSHFGAINAYGTIINTHFVTVVGEVPRVTVETIGSHLRYQGTQHD
jgi:sigma-E factor negative regulatory protein RseB